MRCRARNGITDAQVNVDVCVFLFDLLYLDGKGMMHSSFRQRRHALTRLFTNLRQGYVEMARGFELEIPGAGQVPERAAACEDINTRTEAEGPRKPHPETAGQQQTDVIAESTNEGLGTVKKQCEVSIPWLE